MTDELMQWADAVVLACRPVDPDEYDPRRRQIWNRIRQSGMEEPPVYPGSVKDQCRHCKIDIWLGPHVQQKIEECKQANMDHVVLCLIDAAMLAAFTGEQNYRLQDLGNTYRRKPDA